ncbi:PAS domain-containing sensor histidine kinase [Limnohabitans sp. MMS-10A-160]|uniref:sensor histidine kinase n=1 Tax=unclassified Limnohabitans TaxID=2626134 RepID=UPI000D37D64A|nr:MULTISPECIES: ATP-binding protein [unclassified Limnohabitans]PUE13800.1 PAS domain-containing sensor histidine kinase [Limnohabitans sp. MMS-10A-192]PUE20887.1 PAS domain-containing sensor histidine kinase [Limnohabitans sp. MMS-10A-160]
MPLFSSQSLKSSMMERGTSRWLWGIGVLSLAVIGLGLLVLLTQATGTRDRYNQNYEWLVLVNTVVASGLFITILWGAVRLILRLRRGQFGSRLLLKLAAIFGLVGVVPGVLIYVVSYQFVSRSIESWFDVKVEAALIAGLNLGRATLDTLSSDLLKQSRAAASQLSEVSDASAGLSLEKIREQLGVSDAVLWSSSGRILASAGQSRFQIRPERPAPVQFKEARQKGSVEWVEGFDESIPGGDKGRIKVLVLVPASGMAFDEDQRVLLLTQDLPPTLVNNALEVQAANREYQERALARDGLRRMYIGTLTLSLFMAVLGAILLAFFLGNQLARPLLLLARGMQQVAAGDLTPKLALQGKDELGGLTRSFADMTQQLSDARSAVERSLRQLDAARGNLQTILDNLTAGVMVLDSQGVIQSANPGATRILRVPVAAHEGMPLLTLPMLQKFAQGVAEQFALLRSDKEAHELDHWQKSFEIHATGQGLSETAVTLLARGAVLPDGMRLLVFDDISEIVSAERAQAWGEVARRLAHEIKNPLTPIQLSAERLERKLIGKLDAQDDAVLAKSVKTIVDQVDAMKRLVNEFRDYARLPTAELRPVQLNSLISDLMVLYAHEPSDHVHRATVVAELDPTCPPIAGDEQQLRQVIHNLLQNAQDACDARPGLHADARVRVRTEWNAARSRVRMTVTDSGPGFEPNILQRAFEPYVTTKTKGTGLGLAVVKKIVDEHKAKIELSNVVQDGQIKGAQVSLSFALDSKPGGPISPSA